MIGTENGLSVAHNSRLLGELEEVLVNNIDGDIADIGCWWGTLSFLMAQILMRHNSQKTIYLYDTFSGHNQEQIQDIDKDWGFINNLNYFKSPSIEYIHEAFKSLGFSNYVIVKGDILETLESAPIFCFASLDLNLFVPTSKSLTVLENKLSKDGVVIEDDYNNITGITQAFSHCEWLKVKKEYLPGASFVWKN
jgi:hypothetical protein